MSFSRFYFRVILFAGADKRELARCDGSPAPAMWVSEMSEASVANP
jgi:hypothetical protein